MTASKRNRNNRQRGKAFEKKVADFLGFYRVPYSGSAENFGLGDVRDRESQDDSLTLGECKSITPRSKAQVNYILREDWLIGKTGVLDHARKSDKLPWLSFTKVRSALWFVVILPQHFRMFLRAIEILRHEGYISNTKKVSRLESEIDKVWEEIQGEAKTDHID